jgi:ribose 5-phosphate isomerase B
MPAEKIIIGSDHAGYHLKEAIRQYLSEMGYEITDVGTFCKDDTDYPDFGISLGQKVSSGEFVKGILICGSGVGMTIVANKFPSVRAVLCLDEDTARMSRLHNDTNILVLASRRTDTERAKAITDTWLKTEFAGGRHQRRLDKIMDLERKLCGR